MKREGSLPCGERGFTLVETLVALSISAVILSGLALALYQFNVITRLHQKTLVFNQQIQNAATALQRDVVSASSGTVAGDTLSLSIPSYTFGQVVDPVTDTVSYALNSDTLTRSEGGQNMVVARYVDDVDFGPSGPISTTLHITLSVTTQGETRHATLSFDRRPSP